MKQNTHPDNYRLVVFKDTSCDYAFLTKSTVETKETIKWDDGKEYPLCKIEISNKSHPFFTGKQNLVDTAGRIEKFNQKYGKKQVQSIQVYCFDSRAYFMKRNLLILTMLQSPTTKSYEDEMVGVKYTAEATS